MRAPDFWNEPPGLIAGVLSPVGAALDAAGRLLRAIAHPYRAPVPVICVGNLVAGGSGKTPVALSLATVLATRGGDAAIVMRGYGGRLSGPARVNQSIHVADAVGDEALLAAAIEQLKGLAKANGKATIFVLSDSESPDERRRQAVIAARREFAGAGIAVYPDIERAARTLGKYVQYMTDRQAAAG